MLLESLDYKAKKYCYVLYSELDSLRLAVVRTSHCLQYIHV